MLARIRASRGQVTVEMAILYGFVIAALVAMALYLQRAVQGGAKSNSDSLGTQFSSQAAWNSNTSSTSFEDVANVNSNQTSGYSQTIP